MKKCFQKLVQHMISLLEHSCDAVPSAHLGAPLCFVVLCPAPPAHWLVGAAADADEDALKLLESSLYNQLTEPLELAVDAHVFRHGEQQWVKR